jgi:hypothetical protein
VGPLSISLSTIPRNTSFKEAILTADVAPHVPLIDEEEKEKSL